MFQGPRVLMENENSVEAGGEGGVDIALDAVADHPTGMRSQLVTMDDFAISLRVFFGDDFDGGEVLRQARSRQFVSLLGLVAFGHEDQAMACGQLRDCFRNAGEQFYLLLCDGGSKAAHAMYVLFIHSSGAEALVSSNQGAGKAGDPVAVGQDGCTLLGIQSLADFGGGVFVVTQIADEGS